jgi:hypothetical protein
MKMNELCKAAPSWAAMLVLVFGVWMGGCQAKVSGEGPQFQMLFDGFQLMLADDLPANTEIQEINSSALRNTHPGERTLVPGRVYVFRKTANTPNENLAMKVLPKRLAEIGAQVTKAPQSPKDFIYPFVGGPLFVIEFEKDRHHGTMFNRIHTSEQPGQHWEELIVAYK